MAKPIPVNERRDIIVVTALMLFLPIFSIYIHFIEKLYNFSKDYDIIRVTEYLINFCFLYLLGLLYLTYRRWLKAEKKRTELENIIASINPDVLIVVDQQRKITICNNTIKRMFGYNIDEAIQQTTDLLYFDRRSYPEEKKREIYEILEKEGFHIGLATGKKKNGVVFPLEIITGNLSEEQGAVLLLRDITTRKEIEDSLLKARDELEMRVHERTAELSESEERYRTVIENSNDGIAIVGDEKFTFVNRKFSEIFGYESPHEIEGKPSLSIVHPDDTTKVNHMSLLRHIDENNVARYEFRGLKKNREQIFLEASETAITYFGLPVSLLYVHDITERKSLESQLRHGQKMEAIGQLAGGIAHDFNNMLTALIGFSDLLLMQMSEDDPLRTYVHQILNTSQSAARLTQSLLAFSRKQLIELKPCKIGNVIKGSERLLRRLLSEDISLVLDLDDGGATVMADAGQIEQIFINLATNARDAMPNGGTLHLRSQTIDIDSVFIKEYGYGKQGRYVLLVVSDTGCGIDREIRDKIFDPFFTTKEVGKGTGLGLSIVYGIVKQHDGYITVMSKTGEGTSFHIYLPTVNMDVFDTQVISRKMVGGSETILIAEDNDDVRSFARAILTEFGYQTIEAEDGQEAISLFHQWKDKIDLVIVDVVMPKKNGKDVYKEVKRMNPNMKLLFMSGYTGDVVFDKGVLDTERNFIAKPFAANDLLAKVRELLDG